MGHHSPGRQWDLRKRSLFLLTSAWPRGTDISPRVLHKHLLFRRQAIWAKVWVEVEDIDFRPRHQGPRGVFTPSHHRLSQLINR